MSLRETLFCLPEEVGFFSGVSVKTAEEEDSLAARNELFLEGGLGAKDDDELDFLSASRRCSSSLKIQIITQLLSQIYIKHQFHDMRHDQAHLQQNQWL